MVSKKTQQDSGFTIIELLLVIVLIGVLAGIVMLSLGDQTGKARDAKRKSDVKAVQNALQLYYNHFGNFPNNVGGSIRGCGSGGTSACTWGSEFSANSNVYMAQLPSDPSCEMPECPSEYRYTRNTVDSYSITSCLEFEQDPECTTGTVCPSGMCDYVVTFN